MTPDAGAVYTGSSSNCSPAGSSFPTVFCTAPSGGGTVSVSFGYQLTLLRVAGGALSWTASPGVGGSGAAGNVSSNSAMNFAFPAGSVLTLTAAPNTGNTVTWSGACASSTGNTCTVTMDQAKSATATFSTPLSVVVSGPGTVKIGRAHV